MPPGGTLEHVCRMTTCLLDRARREPVCNIVVRHLRGIAPCGTGPVVAGLAMADMLGEFDVVMPDWGSRSISCECRPAALVSALNGLVWWRTA